MKIPTFVLDGKTYRFARLTSYESEVGYGHGVEVYNVVQRKRWWGWQTVETEHVPSFAWIASATLGSTDWESQMIKRWKERIDAEQQH